MSDRNLGATGFVLRPAVALVIPCVWVGAYWLIGTLATAKYGPAGTPLRLISSAQFVGVSIVNAVLMLLLALDLRAAWRMSAPFGRGQIAGVLFAMVNVIGLQIGLILASIPVI